MDAAHKIIKTVCLLSVIALLMAAPGWAQVLTAPLTVSLSGSGGQQISVTSSTTPVTEITYTIGAPNYSSDASTNGIWLAVSGGATTPATLTFSLANVSGLSQGSHTATVTLTPTAPASVAPVTITVTFTSGAGTGGSGTLTAVPNPINVSAAVGGQSQATVTISTTSTTAITISSVLAAATPGGWLTAGLTGSSTVVAGSPTSILVTANAFGLAASTSPYQSTVTVTPATGTPLVIPINFTVGGSGGSNGAWSVTPNTAAFTFTTNSGVFPSTPVTVSTTTGFGTYTASATSSGGWLLVNGNLTVSPSIGTALTLSVGSNANTLTTGSYTGTVSISDPNGVLQLTVGVTLSVNGGNSTGLLINPNPLTVNTAVNGQQQNPQVTVTSSTGGVLSVSGSLPSWLTFQPPANTTVGAGGSVALTLNVNPTGLAANTYTASLGIAVGSQSATLNVNLVVGSGTGTGTGTTAIAPSTLFFSYQAGTLQAAIARQKVVVTGPAGAWSSAITTSNNGAWLQLSPTGGASLPDPINSPLAFIDPTGLALGTYTGTIAITTPGGTQSVSVTLVVSQGPVLVPTPGDLVFVAQTGAPNPQSQSVFFSGTDSTVGPLAITATANNPWISVTASPSGMSVSVDPTGLATGVYSGSITVNQANVANNPYTYPIVLVVNGGGSGGSGPLTFTPASLSFSSANGSTPAAATLAVSANVATSFTYSTTYQSGSGWLSIGASSSVTPANLSVSVLPSGLAAGTYNATISFSSNGTIQAVPVTLTVTGSGTTGGNVTVSPTSLSFTGQVGATSLATQALTVTSTSATAPVSFTVTATSTGSWLSTDVTGSATTQKVINVTANPTGLAAGTYNGNLAIQPTGGTLVNVPVTLTISATPTVSVTPTTPLAFNYRAGDSLPAAQPLTVSGGGATLSFTATAVSAGNWLVVTPTAGTTPGTVSVTVTPGTLAAGQTYNGTVTIAGANGASGSTTVNVSLTVTAPLPTVTKVTNAGSFATGAISPGEIITLFAADPTHPIGPATPAFLTLDSTGKVATTIGGVQVQINGFLAPMIFANATQISAVVPYELARFTGSTVPVLVTFLGQSSNGLQVTIATTAPGLFTANSSGTGPGAILNSDNSLNAPANPATRGGTVVVYLTGEGQTSPPGVTGGVTKVSAAPPLTPGPLLPVSITVGGQPAGFSFAGEAPTFVAGVMQLNVQVPTNIGPGEQEILVTIGGNQSQRQVTVSVK